MNRSRSVRCGWLAAWFACAGVAVAFQQPAAPRLPDFDLRQNQPPAAPAPSQAAARETLRGQVPGLRVDFDAITGSPKWVNSSGGYLSGPAGKGRGISAAAAAAVAADDPHHAVKAFLVGHRDLFGHGPEALEGASIKREFVTPHNGLRTVVWEQQFEGIGVYGATFIAHTTKNGELVNLASQFVPDPAKAANGGTPNHTALVKGPKITARQSVALAARNVGDELDATAVSALDTAPAGAEQKQRFQAAALKGEIHTRLVWLPMNPKAMRLCWDAILTSRIRGEMFRVLVDAASGEVLLRTSLTHYLSDATYRVFTSDSPSPFSPGHPTPLTNQPPVVPRVLVITNALSTNASPNGWINDGDNETRGNNVDAHLDRNADDQPDLPRPQGSPARVFDFAQDLSQSPTSYGNASVVQLFYWCNWMHDQLYELGFTEAAGNFQNNNFGRGGSANDALQADAQDGEGFNNANMSTPPDGIAPRMQMFIFDGPIPDRDGDLDAEVILHEYTHGLSNRRVGGGGGMDALQSGGMGEGWSDFYGFALLSEPSDDIHGNYAAGGYLTFRLSGMMENYYFGIRRYPYSTDMTKNPLTFKDIDPAQASAHPGVPLSPLFSPFSAGSADEVHNMGEVWCVTLWDARANLIQKHGFAVGNRLILQIVTDAMNLTPANPDFLQARDAIIQADLVNSGGANYLELWAAFAKRGMGFNAYSPSSSTTAGIRESFDLPDDLLVQPGTGFVAKGPAGGPFIPDSRGYALTNTGSNTITWLALNTNGWLQVAPAGGVLARGGSTNVTVSLTPLALGLSNGVYTSTVRFTNQTSGIGQGREFGLRVGQPDYYTEMFSGDNDLAYQVFTFTPDGSTSFYSVCREAATNFLADPAGGVPVSLSDDDYVFVTLSATNTVALYGNRRPSFYIGSNGYLTFDQGDDEYEESLSWHFSRLRVAALFDDFDPENGGTISWKELSNRVAVTWLNVPEYGTFDSNSFQIELFFDGVIRLTYLGLQARDGLVGLSQGLGVPDGFVESDFSALGPCAEPLLLAAPVGANENAGVLVGQGRVRLPFVLGTNVTVRLTSSDTNRLTVPASVVIVAGETNATFDLTLIDDLRLDGTRMAFIIASAPGFRDGVVPFAVYDNETAVLQVSLPAQTAEGAGSVTGLVQVSAVPAADIAISLTSSDTNEIQVPPSVLLPAGQTSLAFVAAVVDDTIIDGPRSAVITAEVMNWTAGTATITVQDNETLDLSVLLPVGLVEGQGVRSNAARVHLSGTLRTNLVVNLASSDTTELTVPAVVSIAAGQISAGFDLAVVDDAEVDGVQIVQVSASTPGFVTGVASMKVFDDESPPEPFAPQPPHLAVNVPATNDLSWSVTGGALANGDFERGTFEGWQLSNSGSGGWYINNGSFLPQSGDGATAPFAGSFSAITDQSGPGRHVLSQVIVLPPSAGIATLRWVDRIRNYASVFATNQYFRVEVRDTNEAVLAVAFTTRPGDVLLTNWVQRSFDLTPYVGQTVRVVFEESDALSYLTVHLDAVQIEIPTGGVVTNEVYFGTNPTPGPAEFRGSTTNNTWVLPTLTPMTTYYWQVVARRVGTTASPVWQFTTRGVNRFEWGPIPSPKYLGVPFTATVTARDELGATVTNFTGPARLSAVGGSVTNVAFSDSFEDGDFADWTVGSDDVTRAVTSQTAADGQYSFTIAGGTGNHQGGILHGLPNLQPDLVRFHTRISATNGYGGYCVIGSGPDPSQTVAFFYHRGIGGMGLFEDRNGFHGILQEPNRWYEIALALHWDTASIDLSIDGTLIETNIPFRGSVSNLTTVALYNYDNVTAWWDDIGMLQGEPPPGIAVSPTNSGAFTDGAWTGQITVLEPGEEVHLLADDLQGHRGFSSRFAVVFSNDVSVAVTDSPDPVAVSSGLVYALAVTNTGPADALAVTLTNWLPPGVTFMNAVASQGSCGHVAGVVTCSLGTLAGGGQAWVQLVVRPSVPGIATNRTLVVRDGADGYTGNNAVTNRTTVVFPALSIGDVSVIEGNSGATSALFTVTLAPPAGTNVTVQFATANGTAVAGSDYLATNGVLMFLPGQTNQQISVVVLSDTNGEASETFAVNLFNPINAVLGDAQGLGTIVNDDLPPFAYVRSAAGPPWGSSSNESAMNRAFGSNNWQDLRYESVNPAELFSPARIFLFLEGSDQDALEMEAFVTTNRALMENWVAAGGTLFLNAAPNEGDGMPFGFGVTLVYPNSAGMGGAASPGHPIFQGPFTPVGGSWTGNSFAHASVTGAAINPLITNASSGSALLAEKSYGTGWVLFGGMTTDNFHLPQPQASNLRANILVYTSGRFNPSGLPVLSIGNASAAERNAGLTPLVFQLSLNRPTNATVSVAFATSDGTAQAGADYLGTNGVLTFAPGQTNQTITVFARGDTVRETSETFLLTLSNPTNALLVVATATGTIVNDDVPANAYVRSAVGAPWGSSANEAAMTRVFGSTNWQDLRYETVSPAELFASQRTFVFMEGGDQDADEMEAFISNNLSAMESWVAAGGTLFLNAAPSEGNGMALGFGVTLVYPDLAPSGTAADGSHPLFAGPFTPVGSSWSGSFARASVTGSGVTPLILATNGDFLLAEKAHGAGWVLFGGMTTDNFHSPQPQASNLRANILAYTNARFNPSGLPVLSMTGVSALEGDAGVTPLTFPLRLSRATNATVAVEFATSDGTALAGADYQGTNGLVVFAPGQTNQFITVFALGDADGELNETFTLTLSNPTNAYLFNATATGTIINDDLAVASVPFVEDWESGVVGPVWTITGTGPYRSRIVSTNIAHGGTRHLAMDSAATNVYARNEVTLAVNLANQTNVVLQFWAVGFGDEANAPPPSPFPDGADFDGVAMSSDGFNWYEVQPLRPLGSGYALFVVDLDAAIAAYGLSYTPHFRIRFNQYDNFGIPTDGIAIDDISLTGTRLGVVADAGTLAAESCAPTNGIIDPGETVTVKLSLRNTGLQALTNVSATLLPGGGVFAPSGPQPYGTIPAGGPPVTNAFSFVAGGPCGGTLIAKLLVWSGDTLLTTVTFPFGLGQETPLMVENFDALAPPALPAGWSAAVSGAGNAWRTLGGIADSPSNSVFAPAPDGASDNRLLTPVLTVASASARLTFRHRFSLEEDFDGGVLELAVNGGPFTNFLSAGGMFLAGGYNGTIASGPAWTGESAGFITTEAALPASVAGEAVQLRWRLLCDESIGGPGWYIDSIALTDCAGCDDPGQRPIIKAVTAQNGTITLYWLARPMAKYRVQFRTDMVSADWQDLPGDVTATSTEAMKSDHPGSDAQRFYRVVEVP